jgi:hypothetical protein
MDIINQTWTKSKLPVPKIKILYCDDRLYSIVDDRYSIITAISKTNVVYAISKTKSDIKVMSDSKDFMIYYLEDPRNLRVISCSESSIKDEAQKFVIREISPLVQSFKI